MTYLFLFFGAIIFTMAATPVLITRAGAWGLLDYPDARKTQTKPMSVVGGAVLFPLVVIAYLIAIPQNQGTAFILTATAAIFVLGILDDLKGVHFSTKFFVQVTAALLIVQSGVLFDLNRIYLLKELDIQFGLIFSTAVTVVWVVGITNAVNLIDGMDGLASGLCLNASVGIGAVAFLSGKPGLAMICAVLAGGLLGFLRYNAVPARAYLGDSGSMLLGFTLAVISIMQTTKTSTFLVLVIPVLLLAIPMADTSFAFLRRTLRGENPFKPDRRHLHHRLLEMNFSDKQVLGIFYGLSAVLGVLALWLYKSMNVQIVALALLLLIGVLTAVKVMQVYNFNHLIRSLNSRIRVVARKAVSRERSGEERLGRNITLLVSLNVLNLVLVARQVPVHGTFMAAIGGLVFLGFLDLALNSRQDEPRYEILHVALFLSIVLNQVIILTMLPGGYIRSPILAGVSLAVLTILAVFLFKSGAFATFLQDPVEILGLFIALVIIGLTRNFLNSMVYVPFAAAVSNALIIYTLSKIYLTGYRIHTRFVTAGFAIFVAAMVGMTWMKL